MTRDDLFNVCTCSSSLITHLINFHADKRIYCPPVPVVAKTLKKAGVFDPLRVFGVTTLDVVRAVRFLGEVTRNDPKNAVVPVIGGHSGATIVPLLSQNPYGKAVTDDDYAKLVYRIQYGGDEVVKAKDGAGSATLSMAYAGAKFTNTLLRGLNGEKGVITPTSVKSDIFADKGVDFSNVELGVCVRFKFDLEYDVESFL
jgi:malate dehydrogenase